MQMKFTHMHNTTSRALVALMAIFICYSSPPTAFAQKPNILCLHGGGMDKNSMAYAVQDIENALPEYEFFYANGAYAAGSKGGSTNSYLWIKDPPNGKDEPTTDPSWADESIEVLNGVLEEQGPFYGILGYSQGAAFVPVYLSKVPKDTFQIAITFCGYLTATHVGLLEVVQDVSPFNGISHLVWMGSNDKIILNSMTTEMADEFTDPKIVESNTAGHNVPGSSDPTFGQVVSWIREQGSSATSPAPVKSQKFTSIFLTTLTASIFVSTYLHLVI